MQIFLITQWPSPIIPLLRNQFCVEPKYILQPIGCNRTPCKYFCHVFLGSRLRFLVRLDPRNTWQKYLHGIRFILYTCTDFANYYSEYYMYIEINGIELLPMKLLKSFEQSRPYIGYTSGLCYYPPVLGDCLKLCAVHS